jgi:hypothetical protein
MGVRFQRSRSEMTGVSVENGVQGGSEFLI